MVDGGFYVQPGDHGDQPLSVKRAASLIGQLFGTNDDETLEKVENLIREVLQSKPESISS
jgi:hypothetical protein